jgi:hypothetical protein
MDHFYRLAFLATGFSCLLAADTRFEISFPAAAHAGSITGRVYLMIASKNDPEPRLQIGRTGAPFFGRDVENLAPGQAAVIDASDLGSPVLSLSEIPAGDYWVQAFVKSIPNFAVPTAMSSGCTTINGKDSVGTARLEIFTASPSASRSTAREATVFR